jgi:glycosyltransferase involved in cell wall biosynthesis
VIDLLIPVLGRPQNVQPLIASIKENTAVPHRIVFVVGPNDPEEMEAVYMSRVPYIRCPKTGYAAKINLAASLSTAEFVFLGADDIRFHPDWDRAAIQRYYDTGCPVIGTNDLGNPTVMRGRHATHLLVHRSYLAAGTIDETGKLLHEGYGHQWVDTEFIETAKKRGAWTFCSDSIVEHMHPFWHKGEDDAIYRKGRSTTAQDMRLFRKRRHLWR